MNILFCNFDEVWHSQVLSGISDLLHADIVVSLSSVKHELVLSHINKYEWIDSSCLNYHKYSAIMQDPCFEPVDAQLIQNLLWCEELYLPMLDRSELVLSKRINYKSRKEYYYNDLRILRGLLIKYRIDKCIFSSTPHVGFDYALYGLCKNMGIDTVMLFNGVIIPGKSVTAFFFADPYSPIPQLREKTWNDSKEHYLTTRMQSIIDHYSRDEKDIKPLVYVSDYADEPKPEALDIIRKVLKRSSDHLLIATIKRRVHNMVLKNILRSYFEKHCVEPHGEKYIYFPLHYQPECTSLPMGGHYYDQRLVIQMIAAFLPDDVTLYVKPHPNRSWFADTHFYNEIRRQRNVKLLSPDSNTYHLTDNALAVVSLTGTAICEALVREKPVIMFGYYIWQYAPGVFHCVTNEDCKHALERICSGDYSANRNTFTYFLEELDKYLVDGAIQLPILKLSNISMEDNISNLIKGYVGYIENRISGFYH